MSAAQSRSEGAVAAGHAAVARVGAQVLDDGGNAVDAVVAMVSAGCVCEPTLTSFGGGGFMIVGGGASEQPPILLDFFSRQPGLEARPRLAPWEVHALEFDGVVLHYGTGPASVAVPGVARGIAHAARRYGRLPLAQSLAPSIVLASEGVPLTRTQAGEHEATGPLISRDPHGAAIWELEGGRYRTEGELFRQPDMARAIELLAATDGESLHVGELADALMAWSDERGASISRTDLARFEVYERTPLQLCVGDICMYGNPEPSMGGGISLRLLQAMLENRVEPIHNSSLRREPRDLAVGRALVRVLRQLDPPRTKPPERGERAIAALLTPEQRSAQKALGDAMHDRGLQSGGFDRSPNTTHVSAIDSDGLLCGATTTVGYGSGEFIPATGIHLNNMLAEYDHTLPRMAGTTVPSMMTPTILTSPRTLVQLGSAGSDRIPVAIAQILERMWHGAPLEEAIRAPRFAFDGRILHAEPGLDDGALEELDSEVELVRWPELDPYFGTTNGTAMRGGRPHAAGDPRREAIGLVL
ncbi:MAG: putative gamma-glutamyltranspeptidase [Thermoleophilia bacterium]|nr:putative gamma-glutamyltranspeptidase [Thermoleophilia bacterium]